MTILVVGALHLDVVVRAAHIPALDETLAGSGVDYVFGGKGGNQALAAARLGGTVHFAGRAGSDAFGDVLRARLAASPLNISQLQRDPGPSGMSSAIVNDAGEYGAVIVSAANLAIDADQIEIPPETSLVLLQNEIPHEVNLAIAQRAQAAGATVWLNAAPARALSDDMLACVDLLIVNRVEAAFYADMTQKADVLTTLGGEGVTYGGSTYPACDVAVASTHGAGDMFVGALAAFVSQGASMYEALPRAQAAAAWLVATPVAKRDDDHALYAFLDAQLNR